MKNRTYKIEQNVETDAGTLRLTLAADGDFYWIPENVVRFQSALEARGEAIRLGVDPNHTFIVGPNGGRIKMSCKGRRVSVRTLERDGT